MAITLFGTYYALKQFKSVPPHLDAPFGLFPVSILKPLKGLDPGTVENLESFFTLNYPEYELIFSVADPGDPAVRTVREMMRRFPQVPAQLIIGEVKIGPNPKVNNLVKSYDQAQYDLILISDSNVRVNADYLKRLVAHLDNGVGVITAVVAGTNAQGLGGHLEAIYLNTFYARFMHLAAYSGRPCVVGKSMLLRRSHANRFGGIRGLGQYLAEDYMAGVAMKKLGLEVVIMTDPVRQQIGKHSVRDFWSRHLRWGRIRKSQAPVAFTFEPLFGCFVSGLIGAWAAHSHFGVSISSFLAWHLIAWAACDFALARKVAGTLSFHAAVAWFIREITAVALWAHVASGNSVLWRGQKLTLEPGGLLKQTS